jgi:aspartate-semialdehyde dehydrogenase
VQKIAIVGASTLLGKELKDLLLDSAFGAAEIILFDEEDVIGQLEQIGDEVTFVGRVTPESFESVDFVFFTGSKALTELRAGQAMQSGAAVIDLSGALDSGKGVLIGAPLLAANEQAAADLLTTAIVPADPAALALALVMERIQKAAPIHFAAATILQPASQLGSAAMDELHQQTVNLLSFQTLPRAVFDAQVAYNLLSGFGEAAVTTLASCTERVRRHYTRLAGKKLPQIAIQLLQAPIFHGHCFSIAIELEHPVDLSSLEQALSGEHIDLVLEDTDSPSNLAATGQSDLLVRLRPEDVTGTVHVSGSSATSRFWLWVATDNLRLNAANAIECALELRKVRPQGKVQ